MTIKDIGFYLMITAAVYLLGSFVASTFDTTEWGFTGRLCAAVIVSCLIGGYIAIKNIDEK